MNEVREVKTSQSVLQEWDLVLCPIVLWRFDTLGLEAGQRFPIIMLRLATSLALKIDSKKFLELAQSKLDTMLIFDADNLFWEELYALHSSEERDDRLKKIFRAGYSYTACRQVSLLHEECSDEEEYEKLCQKVAAKITMYPEVKSLLERVVTYDQVGAPVVTCGLLRA